MKKFSTYLILVVLPFSLFFNGCKPDSLMTELLPQDPSFEVYFNHRNIGEVTYRDPYRKIAHGGDNLEAVIIEAINNANVSIDLAVQELQLPEIALALAERYRTGIRVRVVLENQYSRSLSDLSGQEIATLTERERDRYKQYFQLIDINQDGDLSQQEINSRDALVILRNAGIPIIDDTEDGSKGSGLMHHKFMVIDNKTVVTGSANFTLSGIHGDYSNSATRGNVNNLLKISNAQVANLFAEEFNYMWGDGEGGDEDSEFGIDKIWRSPKTIYWDNTAVTVQFSPTSKTQDWFNSTNGLIGKTLSEANSAVDLALFVFSEQKLADILEKKRESGVEIRALIDRGFAFRYYSEGLDMLGVALSNKCKYEKENNPWNNPINDVGIADLARGDKLHHKFAIVDGNIIIAGSQNWSNTANVNNDETVLIIQNSTVAAHFQQEFNSLYRSSILGLSQRIENKIQKDQQKCK
ncbi:phospholipase D-like domain-containing protein [Xenococcus sp. PCC 7305]|uniref:phospholipase D-like domain-containing protein n=1 Tax=Xenococcus sp. PCC 7305 TaxID=102125 RepID=UPI0005934C1E|nr:phospholipase D-like domain-containing protein [Xenococcus sp. PCC 7305]